tara:strand:- start:1679 stop:3064 length:1386 start_codon:yes stop_codon:yes gene_type:complete
MIMATRKAKITKQTIKSLKPGEIVWDTELAGFGVRCQVKAIVYILKKRIKGTQRWLTIGKHGEPWNPDKARTRAKIILGQIADNKDPAQVRDDLKGRPTVKELCNRFMNDYAKEHKKQSSVNVDQMNIDNHILPLLGKKFVEDVTLSDVDAFKRAVKAGKTARGLLEGKTIGSPVKGGSGAANRCLALLSTAFNLAIKWGWRTDNPVSQVEKYKERKIERYLSEVEFEALAEAIQQEASEDSNPYPIAAIKLLIFTGARRNEILTLKWDQVDLDLGIISLTDSKTGAKPIYLNAPAKEILAYLPKQKGNPYVICGANMGAHLVNLRKPWCRTRDRATKVLWQQDPAIADYINNYKNKHKKHPTLKLVKSLANKHKIELGGGLQDVRLHDLRHSFASVAAMGGMSLPMIGKLLGHAQATTTARYAHLADDPVKAANEAIGRRLDGLMGKRNRNVDAIDGELA